MIDVISASVGLDHIFNCTRKKIARVGEDDVICLEITLASELCNCWAYLDFKRADEKPYRSQKLEIVDNKISYNIPKAVLNVAGELWVQVVLQKESGATWKSYSKKYFVDESVNAVDEIPYTDKGSAIALTDKTTGKRYKIYVADGKLTMEAIE